MCAALRPGRPPPSATPAPRPLRRGERWRRGVRLRSGPPRRTRGPFRRRRPPCGAALPASGGGARRCGSGPGSARAGKGSGPGPRSAAQTKAGGEALRLCAAGTARRSLGGRAARMQPSLFSFLCFFFFLFFFFPLFRSPPSPPRYTRAVAPAGWPWQKNTSPHPKCTAARPGDECGRQQGARSAGQGCGGGGRAALRPRSAAARCGAPRSPPSRDVGAGLGLGASRVAGREGIERTEGFGGCPVGAGSGGVGGPAQWRGFLSEVAAVGSSALRDGPERRGSAGEGRRCCHRDVLCWCWSVDVQDSF